MRFIIITRRHIIMACAVLLLLIFSVTGIGILILKPSAATSDEVKMPLPILMYHSTLKDTKSAGEYIISPDLFKEDMVYLKNKGFTTVFMNQVTDYVKNGTPLPEKPIVITFDDGYLNNLTYVLPILEELDLKAVISVVGKYSENFSNNRDPNPAYAYLTWEDIKLLSQSGRVEIGNHTYDMHSLTPRKGCLKKKGENSDTYINLLKNDISNVQNLLTQNSGITPTVFAYPYGAISKESLPVIKELGFTSAFTCIERINYLNGDPEQLYNLYRFNRPAGISTEAFMKKIIPPQ